MSQKRSARTTTKGFGSMAKGRSSVISGRETALRGGGKKQEEFWYDSETFGSHNNKNVVEGAGANNLKRKKVEEEEHLRRTRPNQRAKTVHVLEDSPPSSPTLNQSSRRRSPVAALQMPIDEPEEEEEPQLYVKKKKDSPVRHLPHSKLPEEDIDDFDESSPAILSSVVPKTSHSSKRKPQEDEIEDDIEDCEEEEREEKQPIDSPKRLRENGISRAMTKPPKRQIEPVQNEQRYLEQWKQKRDEFQAQELKAANIPFKKIIQKSEFIDDIEDLNDVKQVSLESKEPITSVDRSEEIDEDVDTTSQHSQVMPQFPVDDELSQHSENNRTQIINAVIHDELQDFDDFPQPILVDNNIQDEDDLKPAPVARRYAVPSLPTQGLSDSKANRKSRRNGLAARLLLLLDQQKRTQDTTNSLLLAVVLGEDQGHSFVTICKVVETDDTSSQDTDLPLLDVIFPKDAKDTLAIAPGSFVRIFEPWQEFRANESSKAVLLCTKFSIVANNDEVPKVQPIPLSVLLAEQKMAPLELVVTPPDEVIEAQCEAINHAKLMVEELETQQSSHVEQQIVVDDTDTLADDLSKVSLLSASITISAKVIEVVNTVSCHTKPCTKISNFAFPFKPNLQPPSSSQGSSSYLLLQDTNSAEMYKLVVEDPTMLNGKSVIPDQTLALKGVKCLRKCIWDARKDTTPVFTNAKINSTRIVYWLLQTLPNFEVSIL